MSPHFNNPVPACLRTQSLFFPSCLSKILSACGYNVTVQSSPMIAIPNLLSKYCFTCSLPTGDIFRFQAKLQQREGKFLLAPMGVLAPGSAHARPSARPLGRGGADFIFLPEFVLFLFRSPCKHLNSYNNPFCGFE